MDLWTRLAAMVESHGLAALIRVVETQGSTPREAGAWMVVRPDGGFHGSIGGGTLEWQALARAQAMLAAGPPRQVSIDQALGPDLGQCCGGRMRLAIDLFGSADAAILAERAAAEKAAPPALEAIALFGAGHVGRAVALALAPLPFRVLWHDERPGVFPAAVPANAEPRGGPALAALAALPEGAQVLVMTHSHALDLAIVAAALADPRLPQVGLIGSATKRARFVKRLAERGLSAARLRCPIGLPAIAGKEPAVIAASVAAECLILRRGRSIKPAGAALRQPA